MWKYVTRRIKDTVERTYNVLDVRISWPCGNEANNEDSAAGQRKNKPHRCNYALWYKAKAAHSEQSSSSRSEQKHNGNTQGLFQRPIFDAFILVCAKYYNSHAYLHILTYSVWILILIVYLSTYAGQCCRCRMVHQPQGVHIQPWVARLWCPESVQVFPCTVSCDAQNALENFQSIRSYYIARWHTCMETGACGAYRWSA